MTDARPGPLLQPRGPLPGRVYWVRRVVLGLVVLGLLVLGLRACGSDPEPVDGASGPGPASPTSSPTGPAEVPSVPAVASPSAAPSPPPAPEVLDCAPSDVAIGLDLADGTFPVGGPVVLPVTVSTLGTVPCRLDVGPASLQVVVLSGGDRVWARQDCDAEGSEVVTLAPGAPVAAGVTWDGVRSAPGCPGDRATARAGTYRAVVTVLGVSTPEVAFPLR